MRKLTIVQAIRTALAEEMRRDADVCIIGEDVVGNVYGYTGGLYEEFGADRVRSTPLSEAAYTGVGVGAAITGLRPVIDWTRAGCCAYVSMDQCVNMAAKYTYTYGGQFHVPLVIMTVISYNSGLASQHSDRPHPLFMNIPGLKIVMPTSPRKAYGLLKAAIRDNDPVMFIRDGKSSKNAEEIGDDKDFCIPIGKGSVLMDGTDMTVVAIGSYVDLALKCAELVRAEQIHCEVIDPMTLKPLDYALIGNSLKKTGKLLVIDSAIEICSAGRDIAAVMASDYFSYLKKRLLFLPLRISMCHIVLLLNRLFIRQKGRSCQQSDNWGTLSACLVFVFT